MTEATRTRPRPTERRYGGRTAAQRRSDRRERMLTAGLEAFATTGYAATTITALCAAANVSTRNFYEEFGSLEEVLVTLLDESRDMVAEQVNRTFAETADRDVTERIDRAVRSYLEALTADPLRTRILLVETMAVSSKVDTHRGRMLQQFVGLVESEANRARAEGIIADRDYHLTSVAIVGMLSTLVTLWASDRSLDADLDDIADEAIRLIQSAFSV